jgi:hypothetical protein
MEGHTGLETSHWNILEPGADDVALFWALTRLGSFKPTVSCRSAIYR